MPDLAKIVISKVRYVPLTSEDDEQFFCFSILILTENCNKHLHYYWFMKYQFNFYPFNKIVCNLAYMACCSHCFII